MNVVGKFGSFISQGVYTIATPFHPFGGAVDVIVVEQKDGSYLSTPWYVRFGKFQGVLKGSEKVVGISVNGVDAGFHMYLDNSGEAYFSRDDESDNIENDSNEISMENLVSGVDSDDCVKNHITDHDVSIADDPEDSQEFATPGMYKPGDEVENQKFQFGYNNVHPSEASSVGTQGYGAYHYCSSDHAGDYNQPQKLDSKVVLVSVDGHVLTAPISSFKENPDDALLSISQFHLDPNRGTEVTADQSQDSGYGKYRSGEDTWAADNSPSKDVFSVDIDDGSDISKKVKQHPCQLKETSNRESLGETVGNFHSHDPNTILSRQDSSEAYLKLSETTSHVEDDSQNILSLSSVDLETSVSCSLPISTYESSKDRVYSGIDTRMNESDSNSSFSKNMDHLGCDMISRYNDSKLKDNELGIGQHLKIDESNQLLVSTEAKRSNNHECQTVVFHKEVKSGAGMGLEISLCGNLLRAGMGLDAADEAFNAHRLSEDDFKACVASIIKNEKLIVRYKHTYMTWEKAAPIVLGMAVFGMDFPSQSKDAIRIQQHDDEMPKAVEDNTVLTTSPSGKWRLPWIPFRRASSLQKKTSNISNEDVFANSTSSLSAHMEPSTSSNFKNGFKKFRRTNIPTSEQIASLKLREGQNLIAFSFVTKVLGKQQMYAHIYLWKWNAKIVISDVDGTITKSDVLGQFMPLIGKDWTQSGVARLFSAIKENGYQLLFLSARAIAQAYLTRNFLLNLKQDGKALPKGPVLISPDGLFPSLYREVIRRAPHEFKIACLEDIKALFPSDYNPFYAGFGNRDTDELSYRKVGIPKGKIFIINPKGEVAVSNYNDVKSYTSLHNLVDDMFPPTSSAEHESFNSWNYWRLPLPEIE